MAKGFRAIDRKTGSQITVTVGQLTLSMAELDNNRNKYEFEANAFLSEAGTQFPKADLFIGQFITSLEIPKEFTSLENNMFLFMGNYAPFGEGTRAVISVFLYDTFETPIFSEVPFDMSASAMQDGNNLSFSFAQTTDGVVCGYLTGDFIDYKGDVVFFTSILSLTKYSLSPKPEYENLSPYLLPTLDVLPDGPNSGGGGGGGDFDDTSDPTDAPQLPSFSILNSGGLTKAYRFTQENYQALNDLVFTDDAIANLKKLFSNPMDYFIGFSYIPVSPSEIEKYARMLRIGDYDTQIPSELITSQYVRKSFGSINVTQYFGNFLDYSPYTKISIYLPFIGTMELDVDDVMASTVHLEYIIDILTQTCVANVRISRENFDGYIYSYNGNLGVRVPLTGNDYSQNYLGALTMAASAVTSIISPATGVVSAAAAISGAVTAMGKPTVSRSNSLGGTSGVMAVLRPYLIASRSVQSKPDDYRFFDGMPINATYYLGDLSGFTQIEKITIENFTGLEEEREILYKLLYEGVYF